MKVIAVTRKDIPHIAEVLTKAFVDDPIFRFIFQSPEAYAKSAPWLFASWTSWAIRYGRAWMSEDGNAVVLMRSPEHSGMSLWSMIRAGMLPTPWKLGWPAFRRFYFRIVTVLDKQHAQIIGDRPHWYGWMIGVKDPGKGMGRSVLNYCSDLADTMGLPIFLETATPSNLDLYQAKFFEIQDTVKISEECSIYFMVRPAQAKAKQDLNQIRRHEPEPVSS